MNPGRMTAPRRRLLIRPGAVGDFVVSLPALVSIKTPYTEVWCAEQNVPLARFADHAISIGNSGVDRIGVLPAEDVFARLRAFDEICSWYGTAREEFREAVAHLPFRFFAALPPTGSGRNATEFFCTQVGSPDQLPRLETPPQQREGFVILHPFASSPSKRWPLEKFRQLAALIGSTRWCAGPEEPLEDAVRIPNLFELACWISTARAYVGNDSGITHLAAAVGTPVIALFGRGDAAVWAPRGKKVRVISGTPIHSISVEEVLAELPGLL